MKRLLRLCCLLLCAALLPLNAALPAVAENADNGAPSIRVNLRRLNLTDRVDLTLNGTYTVKTAQGTTMAFPKGSGITAQIRENKLYLFYGGFSLCAGDRVYFERNASATQESDGILIDGADGLYPGHLTLSVRDGLLQAVATLSVEDYLLGVVPYEMSESFPLEALKAQAVCARTYALSRVKPSAEWDVVDTTNDQVFHGVNRAHRNTARAVRETAGVVGMYNGTLATCYYSASNGGQTELVENVWSGGGDWGYYVMTDDPYDLENPESIVRRSTLKKNADRLPEAFVEILRSRLAEAVRKSDYVLEPGLFRVDAIEHIELGGRALKEPSRFVNEMTITFRWSGKKVREAEPTVAPTQSATANAVSEGGITAAQTETAEGAVPTALVTPAPEASPTPVVYTDFIASPDSCTLTLPLFPEVAQALKLSINSTDNELITLTETDASYTLESRRYGHGVGMSQRGAQWMAGKYNMTFDQILSFYYPGMTLMVAPSGAQTLTTIAPQLAATPGPAATPTPRPTLMPVTGELPENAYLASVEGIEDNSSLNLRAEPSMAGDILMRLYKHQKLVVLEECEDAAWVRVKTDSAEGYVMLSFLEKVEK